MNKDKKNIDKFFSEYFDSLPQFEENAEAEQRVYNNIYQKVKENRKRKLGSSRNSFFFIISKITAVFNNFSFTSPKFAIGIATVILLTIITVYFYPQKIEDSAQISNENQPKYENSAEDNTLIGEVENDNTDSDNFSNDMKQNETAQSDLNKESKLGNNSKQQSNSNINDIVKQETINSASNFELLTVDSSYISYNYYTRSRNLSNANENNLQKSNIYDVIETYFSSKSIALTKQGDEYNTDWFEYKGNIVKLNLELDTANKDIKILITHKSAKDINILELRNEIEDFISNILLNDE